LIAVVSADVQIGVNALVGHHPLLRTAVQVGAGTQLGHHLSVERASCIGRDVCCSQGSRAREGPVNSTTFGEAVSTWLSPLPPVLDSADQVDWRRLTGLADALDEALVAHPVGADLSAGPSAAADCGRFGGSWLATLVSTPRSDPCRSRCWRSSCAATGTSTCGMPPDWDIAGHGSPQARRKWIPRLPAGELAGIAVTEPHGGSRPAAARARAVAGPDSTWLVTGRKTWISRLVEAAVFVVFFRAPDGGLVAAVVDAAEPGPRRRPFQPTGLAGWSWGVLDLDGVRVRPGDVLLGDGIALLRGRPASYRPLVTATALGGAAAVFDAVTAGLTARQATGELPRLRDSALVALGRAHAQLATGLLGAAVASHLAEAGHEDAELWGAAMKAHGVDTANQAAAELALLVGAAGFRADCRIAKTRRDLNGLLYADGIHDSLYRAAGKRHIAGESTAVPVPRSRPASVPMTA
jgi:alkylation response protein AidB-like acyl-CoA dehydrogenase